MKYSLHWLKSEMDKGLQPNYLFFWGHTAKDKSVIDKSCLSQWWPAAFTVDENNYATAEHWMMAKKALLFDDKDQYQNIITTNDPAKAKKCGRAVKNFDAVVWNSKAFDLVVQGNLYKFSQNEKLKNFLTETGNVIIVEASPYDAIWGIGTKEHETDPLKWKGTNLLGFALMEVRDVLKEQNGKAA
jgi:ribA/ribD-fused uncharacterized protein